MTPFVEGSKTDETMVLEIRTEAAIEEEGECSNGEKTWWGFCNPGNVFFFFFPVVAIICDPVVRLRMVCFSVKLLLLLLFMT